jgi:hypothetical protein
MAEHEAYLKRVAISSLINSITSAPAAPLLLPFVIKSAGLESYGYWAVLTILSVSQPLYNSEIVLCSCAEVTECVVG